MKNYTRTIFITAILIILSSPAIEAKSVIIGFNGNIDSATITTYNITNYTSHHSINAISADIPESTIDKIKKSKKIRYIEDDAHVKIAKKTSPPPQQIDWGIYRINAPATWATTTGNGVKIAIIDTGISKTHPDLTVSGGINLVGTSSNKKWDDDNGHGTHVAGIIAARNNIIGVVGVAPDAELYAVKVLDSYGGGSISDVIEGIDWAVQNNMDIISMSLGTDAYSQAFADASASAYNSSVLLVAAAGNSGDGNISTDDVQYPAKFDSVIAVSAIDSNNLAAAWSADGIEVELAAPFVSGAAALIMQNNAGMSPDEVRAVLANNSMDLGVQGKDNVYGYGLVQANDD